MHISQAYFPSVHILIQLGHHRAPELSLWQAAAASTSCSVTTAVYKRMHLCYSPVHSAPPPRHDSPVSKCPSSASILLLQIGSDEILKAQGDTTRSSWAWVSWGCNTPEGGLFTEWTGAGRGRGCHPTTLELGRESRRSARELTPGAARATACPKVTNCLWLCCQLWTRATQSLGAMRRQRTDTNCKRSPWFGFLLDFVSNMAIYRLVA